MVTRYLPLSDLPVGKQKPLASAIRALIAGGFVLGAGVSTAKAELPTPIAPVTLTPTPVDIAGGQATASVTGNAMTINQVANKATLHWKSFNVGAENSVNFNQPSATSVALNYIHRNNASNILGSLTANGQVYLINQNGFLFGKNSQVNVNSLVASTLSISQADFHNGITKAFDANKTAALQGNGEIYIKDEQGNFVFDQNGEKVKIRIYIEAGAKIKTNAAGGRVIVAAPSIRNEGSIETPDGQTILAAAKDKVYLQEANGDPNIRGLLVEVGVGGDVTNVGKILAERGNASLVGFAVNQQGIASATTSVQLNGSVRLLAREGIQDPGNTNGKLLGASTTRTAAKVAELDDGLGARATVELGSGSITSVNLDADKSATAIDAQAQMRSKIDISGHTVLLRNQSLVQAHSGNVDITAVDNPVNPAEKGSARIYMEAGSKIDVSGVKKVALSVKHNIVNVELRKNELRDAPLQRNGVLYGKKVNVDIRDAALVYDESGNLVSASVPIADIKGAVDRFARNIDERSTSGGVVNLNSSGDVITQAGSVVDFSGGSVAYQAGIIETTKLLSLGRAYDIGKANPNRDYSRILSLSSKHYSPGYVEGKAGGKLNISAYEVVLGGELQGQTVEGSRQRLPGDRALGSSLAIDLINGNNLGKQDVVFSTNAVAQALGPIDPVPRRNGGSPEPVALTINSGSLRNSGLRYVSIKTNGTLTVDKDTRIDLPIAGRLSLTAQKFNVQGSIVTPSGTVDLQSISLQGDAVTLQRDAITLGSSALIDVSGLWVNDWLDIRQRQALSLVSIKGGSVNLVAEQGDLRLEQGSRISADGGAWKKNNISVLAGDGGAITLRAANHDAGGNPAGLILNGDLSAWSLQQGGSLTLETNEVVIGSNADVPQRSGSQQALLLTPEFFRRSGFSSFDLVSNVYGLKVADNVHLALTQRNLQLTSAAKNAVTGSHITDFSQELLLPDDQRKPVNLTLSYLELTEQNRREKLSIGAGALIETEAQGRIALNSDTSIFVDGTIKTPGGSIALNIVKPIVDRGFFADQSIWLGANSRLLAQGFFKQQFNAAGLVTGDVLSGGSVELTANRGYIVTREGSKIDVSGTADTLEFIEGPVRVSRSVTSDGGKIGLTIGEGLLADGEFKANRGGPGAAGGTLTVDLNRDLRAKPSGIDIIPTGRFPDDDSPGLTRTILVSAGNSVVIPVGLKPGEAIESADFSGLARLKANRINDAGFDSINLITDARPVNGIFSSSIEFRGDVQLNAGRQIVLDTPSLNTDNARVTFNTVYAALGSTKVRDIAKTSVLAPVASGGKGEFNLNAKGVDLIGGLSFNGFDNVNLRSEGDFRLRGITGPNGAKDFLGQLNVAGDLTITSSQLYPATLTEYAINISGSDKQAVTFNSNGGSQSPIYSVGGSLTVNAPNIYQNGTLKAPFGKLALNADNTLQLTAGSVTSVSGAGLSVPFGRGSGGTDWLYPLDNTGAANIVINAAPEKRLELVGKNLDLQAGATIDLSGGGDLYAYEFISGSGGSNDVLDPTVAGFSQKFAVIPGFNNVLTPYDPLEFSTSGLSVGASVYLNAGGGLESGWYTLLPAHYALLPGAFLVTPQADTQDQYQTTRGIAGNIIAGRYGVAGTDIQNSRWQGFTVEPGSIARTRSQYNDYSANQFFTAKAAKDGAELSQLPWDAGSLVIDAKNSLTLTAELIANPVGKGRGGQVDITADRLELVDSRENLVSVETGTVGLLVGDLNKLNAPSLLLGGKRSKDANGQRITVSSESVRIDSNVDLKGREILIAAIDKVTVASGAVVESSGKTDAVGGKLLVDNKNGTSDGALLRVSDAGQAEVIRYKTISGNGGVLNVESGARLKAEGSMLLDSSKDTVFDGIIDMQGGSLALNSSMIGIGNAPTNTSGLVLANTDFNVDELKLSSAGDFNIYGGVALNTKQLLISAANINGYNNAGATATISADSINLSNQRATGAGAGNGTGQLTLNAREILLGSGQYAIKGFNNVNFNASEAINGVGQIFNSVTGNSTITAPAVLTVAGDIVLNAGYFSGGNGATTSIDATGHNVTLTSSGDLDAERTIGLGVRWSVTGDSIAGNARFDLPSGILELKALTGNLSLGNGSNIDLSGRVAAFADTYKASAGGSLSLTAKQGDVNLAPEAKINLAGAANNGLQASDAGLLTVNASNGRFNWNGSIDAQGVFAPSADLRQGRFRLDAGNFGAGGFSALNTKLAAAGFNEELTLKQRNGDVAIAAGDSIKAHIFQLDVEQGAVSIDGSIDASGAKAGEVSIYGRNGIALGSTGKVLVTATAVGNEGGKVTLDTVHRDDTGSGVLDLSATGGLIDVSGGVGGAVHLRTGRTNGNAVAITAINSKILGNDPLRTALEATRVYANQTTINTANINAWKTDTANFMNARPVLSNTSGTVVEILPGIEVCSNGNLTLANKWDFMDGSWSTAAKSWNSNWRYTDTAGIKSLPGFLTLRAAGDLNINASLTDALSTAPTPGQDSALRSQDMIQPGLSWSYKLIAGNNVNLAASYTGPKPTAATGTVKQQVVVRTGTGEIDLKAGKDIVFNKDSTNSNSSNNAAAVYTVGATALYTRTQLLAGEIPGIPGRQAGENLQDYLGRLAPEQLNQALRYGLFDETLVGHAMNDETGDPGFLYAEYPTHGGDIKLTASGNIKGVQTGQQMTDWLVRSGVWDDANKRPTAWGVNISGDRIDAGSGSVAGNTVYAKGSRNFNQNVGALGGGNVSVDAGLDILDFSVMIPTTGKPLGVINDAGVWVKSGTVINGGGDLQLTSGKDIVGGEFYTGKGAASLAAGGSIAKGTVNPTTKIGVLLDIGDAKFDLTARQDINLAGVVSPTLIKQSTPLPDKGSVNDTRFFTYGDNSAVNLQSTAGNVVFLNDFDSIAKLKKLTNASGTGFEYSVYPAILKAAAMSGDIRINYLDNANPNGGMTLFPSAKGQLQLLANGNIGTDSVSNKQIKINMSDTDPALLPGIANPAKFLEGKQQDKYYLTRELLSPSLFDSTKIHAANPLHQNDLNKPLIMAKLGNIAFPVSAVTTFYLPQAASFIAGNDISNLSISGQNLSADDVTLIKAGGNINFDAALNSDGGVVANNQKFEVAGPGQLDVIAGKNIKLGSSAGIQTIGNVYNPALDKTTGASINVLAGISDQIDYGGFVNKYKTVSAYSTQLQGLSGQSADAQSRHLDVLLHVLFEEIKQSAAAAAVVPENQRASLYKRGFDAIHALFPGEHYSGDLSLVFSQIKTLAGGGINLVVPGGKVDVGLAGKAGGLSKGPEQLGIVVQQQGDLNLFAEGDINVNQSRVFTLGGGDIVGWSSEGSIDAGKGAKSAISAPAPVTTVDASGNIQTVFPPIISGSGIQAIGGGSVYLAAPEGSIDAGEAGISGNKVIVAALSVIGASNIQSGSGGTVGVPVTVSAPVGLAGADSAATSASKTATQPAAENNNDGNDAGADKKSSVSLLSTDVVGFGECSVGDVKEGVSGCGG